MNKLIYFLLVIFVTFLSGLLLPWWGFIIPIMLLGYIFNLESVPTFLIGTFGVFALWLAIMLFKDGANDAILSTKISTLFQGLPIMALACISALYAGIIGGLSAIVGKHAKELFRNLS